MSPPMSIAAQILTLLAHDLDPRVRSAVAMKNKLSDELFALLADDIDDTVRDRMAYNKNTPAKALRKLVDDSCERVAMHSRERLKSR